MSSEDNTGKESGDHGDGKATSPCQGTKRPHSPKEIDVHSANDWEHAQFGDSDRKQKFLRLMGAGKKEHHGKIHCKETQSPRVSQTDDHVKKQEEGLESQYDQSLEHKLSGGARSHLGLGFHAEENPPNPPDDGKESTDDAKDKEKPTDTEDKKDTDSSSKTEKQESSPQSDKPKLNPLQMMFVKSSS